VSRRGAPRPSCARGKVGARFAVAFDQAIDEAGRWCSIVEPTTVRKMLGLATGPPSDRSLDSLAAALIASAFKSSAQQDDTETDIDLVLSDLAGIRHFVPCEDRAGDATWSRSRSKERLARERILRQNSR